MFNVISFTLVFLLNFMKKINTILALILLLNVSVTQAQSVSPQVFASQGNHYQDANFSVSYTIGEMAAVNTISGNGYIFTQGFHQPDKFSIVTFIPNIEANWSSSTFPNPVSNELNLNIRTEKPLQLSIQLVDAAGRLVELFSNLNTTVGEQNLVIPFESYASGIYTLFLTENRTGSRQSIKIVKTYQ